jgi:ketosteroid isomerase-like protein
MPQQNVEVVRAIFEAWNGGRMNALREMLDPDVIMRAPVGWPEPGPFVAREVVIRALEQLRETFDADWQEIVSDLIGVGDRVAVWTVWHGLGHGPELKQESTAVFTVREGRIFGLEFFWDHEEALEAVGLQE